MLGLYKNKKILFNNFIDLYSLNTHGQQKLNKKVYSAVSIRTKCFKYILDNTELTKRFKITIKQAVIYCQPLFSASKGNFIKVNCSIQN